LTVLCHEIPHVRKTAIRYGQFDEWNKKWQKPPT